MLTFYYATNTCALASHIALEEAGADYETRWIDFGAAEQTKPDYLKINPKGRVPSLVTQRGVLTETVFNWPGLGRLAPSPTLALMPVLERFRPGASCRVSRPARGQAPALVPV